METLQIVDVKDPDFSTTTEHNGSVITVRMRGNWDMKAVSPLDVFTRSLQAQAKQLKATRVIVEMGEVEFINSSCLTNFARWLGTLGGKSVSEYSITFRTNVPWQRRSLEALKGLASDKVTIES